MTRTKILRRTTVDGTPVIIYAHSAGRIAVVFEDGTNVLTFVPEALDAKLKREKAEKAAKRKAARERRKAVAAEPKQRRAG